LNGHITYIAKSFCFLALKCRGCKFKEKAQSGKLESRKLRGKTLNYTGISFLKNLKQIDKVTYPHLKENRKVIKKLKFSCKHFAMNKFFSEISKLFLR